MRLEKEFLIRQHKRKLICQSIWDQNNISQIFTPRSLLPYLLLHVGVDIGQVLHECSFLRLKLNI